VRFAPTKGITVKSAAKPQVQAQENKTESRPTIALQHVIATGTGSFSGWGPKVNGSGNVLKTWN